MMTARLARLLPDMQINAADPVLTATDLSGGEGRAAAARSHRRQLPNP